MCVLVPHGWFWGHEPWCISSICIYGEPQPVRRPPCRAEQ